MLFSRAVEDDLISVSVCRVMLITRSKRVGTPLRPGSIRHCGGLLPDQTAPQQIQQYWANSAV